MNCTCFIDKEEVIYFGLNKMFRFVQCQECGAAGVSGANVLSRVLMVNVGASEYATNHHPPMVALNAGANRQTTKAAQWYHAQVKSYQPKSFQNQ